PIETGATEGSGAFAAGVEIEAEVAEEAIPLLGDGGCPLGQDDEFTSAQPIGDSDSESAGQVVVAGARGSERLVARPSRAIAPGSAGGDEHQSLHGLGDFGRKPGG